MAADDVRFPSPDALHDPHAEEVQALLRASYAALPTHTPEQLARVSRAVLASAMHAPAPGARGVRPRWWWGAAAAAVLVLAVTRPWRPDATQRHADSAFVRDVAAVQPLGRPREEGGTVRFEFILPAGAEAVALVGDFNGWDTHATPMRREGSGRTWSAQIPLEPGRHEYAFVVDGQRWVVDPLAPQVPDAGFGPTNAVVVDGKAMR